MAALPPLKQKPAAVERIEVGKSSEYQAPYPLKYPVKNPRITEITAKWLVPELVTV